MNLSLTKSLVILAAFCALLYGATLWQNYRMSPETGPGGDVTSGIPSGVLTLGDVMGDQAKYVGQKVTVVDYLDTSTHRISLPDANVDLYRGPFDPSAPAAIFTRPIEPLSPEPSMVEMTGTLTQYRDDLNRLYTFFVVEEAKAIPDDAPYQDVTHADIAADPLRYDRAKVRMTGLYVTGFEVSFLNDPATPTDNKLWFGGFTKAAGEQFMKDYPDDNLRNSPAPLVTVEGRLYTSRGNYGHLGSGRYSIIANTFKKKE